MRKNNLNLFAGILILLSSGLAGCHKWDNFTTYFNTYYNADRLLNESESEFEYQDEKKRIFPRVFVPDPNIYTPAVPKSGPPPFLAEFIVNQQKRQPVGVKLDSVLIKGSKILANHPKSDYVENTLFLMANTYFYKEEWLPAQIKCDEMIDRFPDGDLSPDAHMLLSKSLIIQQKLDQGNLMLSRTVDIAWQKERYDILAEAFRLQAELALYRNNLDDAVRPYKQAVAQSDRGDLKARWQCDLAALLYRIGQYERAAIEFDKVRKYSPDYVTEFESLVYRAAALSRLGRYEAAEKILTKCDNDGKYKEWKPWIYAQQMNILRLQKKEPEMKIAEKKADSAYANNAAIVAYYFERGMDYFNNHNYSLAAKYFARSRTVMTPVYAAAQRMANLMTAWENKQLMTASTLADFRAGKVVSDSAREASSVLLFELGRVHEQLSNHDSSEIYFRAAAQMVPKSSKEAPRVLYAYARSIKDSDPRGSDSLYDMIAEKYPLTEYGRDAIKLMGYTDAFAIDTVADLYKSGNDLRKFGDYNYALKQFKLLYTTYPDSKLAPKALYSTGWIYEKNLHVMDTALYYYTLLLSKYPNSEYANEIRLSVDYKNALLSGKAIPDSLQERKTRPYIAKPPVIGPEEMNRREIDRRRMMDKNAKGSEKSANPLDMLKKPGQMLPSPKDLIPSDLKDFKLPTNAGDALKSLKLPTSPQEIFGSPEDLNSGKMDSTKTSKPKEPVKK